MHIHIHTYIYCSPPRAWPHRIYKYTYIYIYRHTHTHLYTPQKMILSHLLGRGLAEDDGGEHVGERRGADINLCMCMCVMYI